MIAGRFLKQDHERELIVKAQAGDPQAVAELLNSQQRFVWSRALWASNYYSNKFRASLLDTEDLVQVGMICLLECVKRYDLMRNVRLITYSGISIDRRIRREIEHHYRRAMPKSSALINVGSKLSLDPASSESLIDDVLLRERDRVVRESLGALKDRHREVLLRRMHGESYRGIANSFGVTHQRVVQLEAAAIRNLPSLRGVV